MIRRRTGEILAISKQRQNELFHEKKVNYDRFFSSCDSVVAMHLLWHNKFYFSVVLRAAFTFIKTEVVKSRFDSQKYAKSKE
jgi:hypothetical protein